MARNRFSTAQSSQRLIIQLRWFAIFNPMHAPTAHAGHVHTADEKTSAGLQTAFFLNLGFTLLELIGGLWTNSVAILSDAVHDAGDCFSVGIAWYLEHLSRSKPTSFFTYGYRRFSVLGGMIT